jgi:hypothetical protein
VALDIQVGLLLPGKAGVGQILGSGTAPHRDIHGLRMAVRAEARIRRHNGVGQRRGPGSGEDGVADLPAPLAEIGEVVRIQIPQQDGDLLVQVCLAQEAAVGVSGNGKARGDAHAQGS